MAQRININISTGEVIAENIPDTQVSLEELQVSRINELMSLYKNVIVQGFTSSVTGVSLFFTYNTQDQLNYNKIATTLALDPTITSVQVGSSTGAVTMTRNQFMQFVQDAKNYEYALYDKRIALEQKINTTTDLTTLQDMVIDLS